MNYVRLLFLLAIPVANIAALEPNVIYEIIEGTPSMIRGGSFGEEHDAHGRELLSFSWSWTNLLCKSLNFVSYQWLRFNSAILTIIYMKNLSVHLGVCHAHANCTMHHPGPCGCPDCNKPHPPHFQNDYCSKEQYSAVSDGESEEELEGDNYGEDGARGEGQQPTRMLKMFAIIAAAAAATVAIGAFVMRKRVSTSLSFSLLVL